MNTPRKRYSTAKLEAQDQLADSYGDSNPAPDNTNPSYSEEDTEPDSNSSIEPSPADIKNRDDWLRTAYSEAWKQVSHEDTLSMQRNGLFIVVQTALLATLASLSTALIRTEAVLVGIYSVPIAYYAIGIIFILFAFFALQLLTAWYRVSQGGAAYVALRWSTARRIEQDVGLHSVSLAGVELGLRQAIRDKKLDFKPYPDILSSDIPSLKEHGLDALGTMGEDAIYVLIKVLRRLWWIIAIVGLGVMIFALLLTKEVSSEPGAPEVLITPSPTTSVTPGARLAPPTDLSPQMQGRSAPYVGIASSTISMVATSPNP